MIITLQPTRGLLFAKSQQALEDEILSLKQVPFVLRVDNLPIPECRNTLVESALKIEGWTHALLLDDDVIIPQGGLKAMLDKSADIAFVDYPMHYTGERWGAMGTASYDNWLPGDPWKDKPVLWAGLGCTLVRREVFEKMSRPWFEKTSYVFERDEQGKATLVGEKPEISIGGGEDYYFFRKAREMKATIKCVHSLTAGHARLVRVVKTLDQDKYKTQHKVAINEEIKTLYK